MAEDRKCVGRWIILYVVGIIGGCLWVWLGFVFGFSIANPVRKLGEGLSNTIDAVLSLSFLLGLPLAFVLFLVGGIVWLQGRNYPHAMFVTAFGLCWAHLIATLGTLGVLVWRLPDVGFPIMFWFLPAQLVVAVATVMLHWQIAKTEQRQMGPAP